MVADPLTEPWRFGAFKPGPFDLPRDFAGKAVDLNNANYRKSPVGLTFDMQSLL
jgi:hypothetical protein